MINEKKLYIAIITPFLKNLKVDYKSYFKIIDKLILDCVDGIIVSGTTGESSTLSDNEKIELFTKTVVYVNNKIEVWLGVGTNDTSKTIKLIGAIENLDFTGLMIVTPYYNIPSSKGLYMHFYTIAQNTKKNIMIYNIPKRCGVHLLSSTIIQLANSCDNIIALKQADNDDNETLEIMANTNLLIYSGDDYNLFEHLNLGMDGIVSVVGHLYSNLLRQIIFKQFYNIDCNSENKLLKDISVISFLSCNPCDIKYMLSYYGYCDPYVRLPLVMLDDNQKKIIESFLDKLDG